MASGGATVAVLAFSVYRAYSDLHDTLYSRIIRKGLLVSEWPNESAKFRSRLPDRMSIHTRIIAAAASATVFVQAPDDDPATETRRYAVELGRPAMVVAGQPSSRRVLRMLPRIREVVDAKDVLAVLRDGCR